jgi:hypothetical protein
MCEPSLFPASEAGFGEILFFVTGGQQPIYDRFAHIAASAIHQRLPPHSDVSYRPLQNWDDYEAYKGLLLPVVHACGQQPGDMTVPRSVDQALWVYGHLFTSAMRSRCVER